MQFKTIVVSVCLILAACSCTRDLRVDRRLTYARPLGRELRLNVYQAKARPEEPLPAIVAIHGGAWLHGPRVQQWWYLHEFARRGYVVVAVDYRKLPRFSFPHCLHDVKGAVRWVRLHSEAYGIDPDRIYAFGASAGGHLAAFLATAEPLDGFEGDQNPGASSGVNAAISLYGAVDLTKFRDPPEPALSNAFWRWYVWQFVEDAGWQQGQEPFAYASPIVYARPFSKPVLFIQGKEDSLVHYQQAVDAHARLQQLGVSTDLMLFENRGHAFDYTHWKQRKEVFARMLLFLEEHGGAPAGTVYSDIAEELPGIDDVRVSIVEGASGTAP